MPHQTHNSSHISSHTSMYTLPLPLIGFGSTRVSRGLSDAVVVVVIAAAAAVVIVVAAVAGVVADTNAPSVVVVVMGTPCGVRTIGLIWLLWRMAT